MSPDVEKKICEMHAELFHGRNGRPSLLVRVDRLERWGPRIVGALLAAAGIAGGVAMKAWEFFR